MSVNRNRTGTESHPQDTSSNWFNNQHPDLNSITERYNSYDSIFKGTDYYNMYKNNPYYNQIVALQPDFWDDVSDWFGIHSNYYKSIQDLSMRSDMYIDDLLQKMQQDKYNSSASQVARDRVAGLNPDLVGASGGMSPAAEMDMFKGAERGAMPFNHEFQPMNLLTGVLQCVDFGLGVADKFIGMRSNMLSNDANELQLNDVLQGIVSKDLLPQLDRFDYNAKARFVVSPKSNGIDVYLPSDIAKTAKGVLNGVKDGLLDEGIKSVEVPKTSFVVPKRYAKRIAKMLQNSYYSPEYKSSHTKKRVDANESIQKLASQNASEFFVGNYKVEDSLIKCCVPLARVQDELIKNNLDYLTNYNSKNEALYENARNKYHRDLYGSKNGSLEGEAFNANNQEIKDMKETRNKALSALREVVDNLYKLTINGNRVERVAAMTTLSGISAIVLQPMNIQGSSSTGPDGKKVSNRSFRIGK